MSCIKSFCLTGALAIALTTMVSTAQAAPESETASAPAAEAAKPAAKKPEATKPAAETKATKPEAAKTEKAEGKTKTTKAKAKPKTTLKYTSKETVIHVGDLHCKHCAKKIASKLYTVKGVVKVRTDIKADVVVVTPQNKKKVDPLALWKAAKTSGFPATKLISPAGTYVMNPKTKTAQRLPEKKPAPKS